MAFDDGFAIDERSEQAALAIAVPLSLENAVAPPLIERRRTHPQRSDQFLCLEEALLLQALKPAFQTVGLADHSDFFARERLVLPVAVALGVEPACRLPVTVVIQQMIQQFNHLGPGLTDQGDRLGRCDVERGQATAPETDLDGDVVAAANQGHILDQQCR